MPEPRTTRLTTGTLPSPPQLQRLAVSRPFVQQIDIILPSRTVQEHAFAPLKTTYSTAKFTLAEMYDYATYLLVGAKSVRALPIQRHADDTWCIDPRGILTLSVSKSLYEKLGLVGKKLPFKSAPEGYVIQVPLRHDGTSLAVRVRQRAALGIWDNVRAKEGLGKWHVAYVREVEGPAPAIVSANVDGLEAYAAKDVMARMRREADVHVPRVGDLGRSAEETTDDYAERLRALFEWVGMACLGAQRLRANDRVDPYVAVYEPPSPSSVGEITHLRWIGLMDSTLVQSVIDTAISILSTSRPGGDSNPFISITLYSNLETPVAYLPETVEQEASPRVPGSEAEDTVCLLLSRTTDKSTWAMAESISKWDARWG